MILGACLNQAAADTLNSCSYADGAGPQTYNFNLPPRLVINSADPVGHELYRERVSGNPSNVTCTPGSQFTHGFSNALSVATGDVYQTNIPGVGVRILVDEGQQLSMQWPRRSTHQPTVGAAPSQSEFTLSLIKTGTITPGTLRLPVELAHLTAAALTPATLRMSNPQTEIVEANPTCSVDAGSKLIPVFLGDYPRSYFIGVNHTTPPVEFTILLNCSGGASGGSKGIRFMITDTHDPANSTSALKLAPGAGASGVGIRIRRLLSGDNPLIQLRTMQNAGTVFPGEPRFEIRLSAQYVQQVLQPQILEGPAPGRASFNIFYN
ncbi:fimbrial protein [Pseudomonas sp. NPDC090755]|uniref:fimbrial protein n=1 Tax=Pseudomonas sp. NPDC090755 TaxID=3364481 RepID=UPI00383B5FA6